MESHPLNPLLPVPWPAIKQKTNKNNKNNIGQVQSSCQGTVSITRSQACFNGLYRLKYEHRLRSESSASVKRQQQLQFSICVCTGCSQPCRSSVFWHRTEPDTITIGACVEWKEVRRWLRLCTKFERSPTNKDEWKRHVYKSYWVLLFLCLHTGHSWI